MTELLEHAVARLRALPHDQQDELARVVLRLAGEDDDTGVYQLTQSERASLEKSRLQAARREFATDEEVRSVWAKHGL
ncbi:hypothetical protein [Rhizobium sp. RU36D]|uniref:hypothetical protein n=1 Tax=Rhizobium sp. RU36D TaxID=1907415 RepID=UPI0009D82FE5|nr:hypothetical protein [Rhizobium sp. RU36D]SMC96414.1 hypothetical protein SAMN05880593_11257 [Rhizobium sp. RU36D]